MALIDYTAAMTPLFKKLNLGAHRRLLVVDAPASFEPELRALNDLSVVRDVQQLSSLGFAIFFVTTAQAVAAAAKTLVHAPGDPIIWFAYPKASSKKYVCDFNRDTGWVAVGEAGFEGVRQVAIDADWTALRFRRVEHIARMKRDPARALTAQGRSRATGTR